MFRTLTLVASLAVGATMGGVWGFIACFCLWFLTGIAFADPNHDS